MSLVIKRLGRTDTESWLEQMILSQDKFKAAGGICQDFYCAFHKGHRRSWGLSAGLIVVFRRFISFVDRDVVGTKWSSSNILSGSTGFQ